MSAAVALAFLLSACSSMPEGPAGRVKGKDSVFQPSTKTRRYYLTVLTPGGEKVRFQVPSDAYSRCYRGSWYRSCLTKKGRS
ncbi:hypothetical protein ACIBAC_00115 [Streptomyces sp. NPDC051362]|uniref:hypothetical protein n=1 Tax=Streptomyces sp. NPDC051362 TaxID=3365651 RepID=UPI0037B98A38